MGATYRFLCAGCGYAAEVSGGGDAGRIACTQTIVCQQCRQLYDVATARRAQWGEGEFKDVTPRCPVSSRHVFRTWESGDPCPSCGGAMENTGGVCLWD